MSTGLVVVLVYAGCAVATGLYELFVSLWYGFGIDLFSMAVATVGWPLYWANELLNGKD